MTLAQGWTRNPERRFYYRSRSHQKGNLCRGAHLVFSGGQFIVTDGPFVESKEVIGGFAILEARSKAHAIELAREFLSVAGEGECEIRLYTPGECAEGGLDVHAELKARQVSTGARGGSARACAALSPGP